MSSTKRKHSGGWQERNRVNKSNPKNIYCLHCKYFELDDSHYTGYCKYTGYQSLIKKKYYQRCKDFDWKENIIDTSEEGKE